MTFTEAAIEVLRREGKPLHFKKIAEIAIRENLLEHVGKIPEETMADQLSAHCRLPHTERRVIPVQPGTFALEEWGLDEDPSGLENLIERPAEDELPYRGRERHPIPSRDLARAGGRGEGRGRRRDEEERRSRRFPPPAEVAYEILAGAGKPLTLSEIAVGGAEKMLMPDAFVRDPGSLQAALSEDNRRRESAGRKALFRIDGEAVTLVAQPEPGERPAPQPAAVRAPGSATEMRRAALATIRRRLRECDGPTVEYVAARLLERLGFRDLKVAKRGREHVIYTGRRRMGAGDVRHGIRVVRSGADVSRREVTDLRRDLGHYGAQLGIVVSAGDAAREARGEAGAPGQLPVVLYCGEAFAEALADAGVGSVAVVVPDVDEGFFRAAAEAAEKEETARRARREERDRRDGRREAEPKPAPAEAPPPAEAEAEEGAARPPEAVAAPDALAGAREEDALDEGEEEGDEDSAEEGPEATASPEGSTDAARAEAGERRRRRRRRRRRGGRGRGREGAAPSAEGAAPADAAAAAPRSPDAAPAEPRAEGAPAEAPPPPRSGEGGPSEG